MPLTSKGETIKSALQKEYGEEKGERVLYAGKNSGRFTGIDEALSEISDSLDRLGPRLDAYCSRGDAKHIAELGEQHLQKTGARLVRTGGWDEAKARAWCKSEGLTSQQTEWVLQGVRNERGRNQ